VDLVKTVKMAGIMKFFVARVEAALKAYWLL